MLIYCKILNVCVISQNSLDILIGRGINIFQAFTSYLKSKKADDPTKEELLKELAALNEHLKTKDFI
jgi:hypothetical protein